MEENCATERFVNGYSGITQRFARFAFWEQTALAPWRANTKRWPQIRSVPAQRCVCSLRNLFLVSPPVIDVFGKKLAPPQSENSIEPPLVRGAPLVRTERPQALCLLAAAGLTLVAPNCRCLAEQVLQPQPALMDN